MDSARVTLTGTGTPEQTPHRAGPGTLISLGDCHLQFDFGRASVLRLAEAGVRCDQINAAFITHHHSDHLVGFGDYLITRWIQAQQEAVVVVAPDGPASKFPSKTLAALEDDVSVRRLNRRQQDAPDDPPQIDVRAFPAGSRPVVVWQHKDIMVSAVAVHHEPVEPAVAYRVDSRHGSVVVSGDTRICQEVEALSRGADVLVHEVIRGAMATSRGLGGIVHYHADSFELGALANRAGVGALVLTHLVPSPSAVDEEHGFVEDVRAGGWNGPLLVGRDLDVVPIDRDLPTDLHEHRRTRVP